MYFSLYWSAFGNFTQCFFAKGKLLFEILLFIWTSPLPKTVQCAAVKGKGCFSGQECFRDRMLLMCGPNWLHSQCGSSDCHYFPSNVLQERKMILSLYVEFPLRWFANLGWVKSESFQNELFAQIVPPDTKKPVLTTKLKIFCSMSKKCMENSKISKWLFGSKRSPGQCSFGNISYFQKNWRN